VLAILPAHACEPIEKESFAS